MEALVAGSYTLLAYTYRTTPTVLAGYVLLILSRLIHDKTLKKQLKLAGTATLVMGLSYSAGYQYIMPLAFAALLMDNQAVAGVLTSVYHALAIGSAAPPLALAELAGRTGLVVYASK